MKWADAVCGAKYCMMGNDLVHMRKHNNACIANR